MRVLVLLRKVGGREGFQCGFGSCLRLMYVHFGVHVKSNRKSKLLDSTTKEKKRKRGETAK